eukprot:2616508-Alexandrium_andersonii.AAC.1
MWTSVCEERRSTLSAKSGGTSKTRGSTTGEAAGSTRAGAETLSAARASRTRMTRVQRWHCRE